MPQAAGSLEIRGNPHDLLDEPIRLRVRGAGSGESLRWRARYRDDEGRVWRAAAERAENLSFAWTLTKGAAGTIAALGSLRPLAIELRAEASDGRAATRVLRRELVADGVKVRRWREGLRATLHLPAEELPVGTVLVDATAGARHANVAALAAPLLASRGVLVLVVAQPASLAEAHERLAGVPSASADVQVVSVVDTFEEVPLEGPAVVLPPGVGAHREEPSTAATRAGAWDRLLDHLGAHPRRSRE